MPVARRGAPQRAPRQPCWTPETARQICESAHHASPFADWQSGGQGFESPQLHQKCRTGSEVGSRFSFRVIPPRTADAVHSCVRDQSAGLERRRVQPDPASSLVRRLFAWPSQAHTRLIKDDSQRRQRNFGRPHSGRYPASTSSCPHVGWMKMYRTPRPRPQIRLMIQRRISMSLPRSTGKLGCSKASNWRAPRPSR